MKFRDVVPKIVLGWGGVKLDIRVQHITRNLAYVMLNWINFTNNYRIVDFLTLIYMANDWAK